jgi:hypothetical protein
VAHGVTPIEPVDPAQPAFRDVLVVTWRQTGDNEHGQNRALISG